MNTTAIPQITIDGFQAGTLDMEAFDHEAHIYMAWLHLEEYPVLEAARLYSDALKRVTAKLGIPDKYHETITWFYMFLIDERIRTSESNGWLSFKRDNADLFAHGDQSVLHRYYRAGTLGSDEARESFLLPDRIAA